MPTLYELNEEYSNLLYMLENTTDDPELIEDTIASTGINEDIENKFESYGQVINQIKADEKAVSDEIKRLSEKKKIYQNNLDRLKNSLINSMAVTGNSKIKTPLFSFSIRNTRVVKIEDEAKLPDSVLNIQPPKPDKKAIKKLIESGEEVPGATIGFNESLTVR